MSIERVRVIVSDRYAWLVVKSWIGGKQEIAGAYLSESAARDAARELISSDYFVSLQTVPFIEK